MASSSYQIMNSTAAEGSESLLTAETGRFGPEEDFSETENQVKRLGFGYNYHAVEQQISSTIGGLVKKLLPVNERYRKVDLANSAKSSISSSERFEKAYQTWESTKKIACSAEERAVQRVEKAENLLKTIQLYQKLFDTLKEVTDNVPDPRSKVAVSAVEPATAPKVQALSASARQGGLPSAAQVTSGRSVSFYKGRPPTVRRKTVKPKPLEVLKPAFRPVEENEFNNVSEMVRGKVKLSDVNKAYEVLYKAFCEEELLQIKLVELAKRGIGVSGRTEMAKLKVLRQLGRIVISTDLQFISPGNL